MIGAFRWYFILQKQHCRVSFSATWKTYLAGFSLLFFVPVFPFASEIFRASYLKEHHAIDLPRGIASVTIDRILEVTSNLFVVVAGGIIFFLLGEHISYSLRTLGVIGFIGIWFLLLFFLYIRIFQKKSIIRLFWKGNESTQETEQEVFRFFQSRSPFLWQGICFSLGKSFVGIVRAWIVILFFGKGFVILPAITIQGFYYLAALVPIPGALGFHEALQAVAFGAFGFGAGTGAAFALLVRTAEVLFAVAGLVLLFHFSLRFLKHTMFRFP